MSDAHQTPKPATDATQRANEVAGTLPFLTDGSDGERAGRGLVARPAGPVRHQQDGWDVWDPADYHFLDGDPPPEVHPSLWRQARLNTEAGLFEVAPGFHQVRGLDLANLTVVDGDEGRIVIDPLTSTETARAALDLVDEHLGARRVTAVIYTHSHVDHYAGVRGVVDEADVAAGRVRIIAPVGFLDAAVSENVVAGPAMTRRATYMYGPLLGKGPTGHVDAGLGKGIPLLGSQGLIAPTEEVSETGTELVVDGVRIIFQVTPDTEAPSEMNFHFPDHRVLCMAENCTCTLHNLYTLRGAQVRDALAWSKYLQEAIELYGATSDVCFASHHWPRWGTEDLVGHLARQRDTYRFLHDQTLRLANHGLTANEIAEELRLPPELEAEPSSRGYYGTVSHNAKAVYQRYLGWYDANPAHLHPHPPVEAARRYVEFMGGAGAVLAKARDSFTEGDYRWVAEVVNHVVFAEPDNAEARHLQADALEQLGYQAESAPWRDVYLTGAQELRHGAPPSRPGAGPGADTVAAMTTEMLFDYLGVRIDGLRAAERTWSLDITVTDRGERWAVGVRRGALHAHPIGAVADPPGRGVGEPGDGDDADTGGDAPGGAGQAASGVSPATRIVDAPSGAEAGDADTVEAATGGVVAIEATHAALAALVFARSSLEELEADGLRVTGDRPGLVELLDVLDRFSLMFPIVTP